MSSVPGSPSPTPDFDAIAKRMYAADAVAADAPDLIEVLEETANDVPVLFSYARSLESRLAESQRENERLRNRSKGAIQIHMDPPPPDVRIVPVRARCPRCGA